MKVYLSPSFDKEDRGDGGIRRIVEAQRALLPEYGIEFVSDPQLADVVNCHATEVVDHPHMVHSIHGLYWDHYWWPKWAHHANDHILQNMKRANVVTAPSQWVAQAVRRGTLIDAQVIYHGLFLDDWSIGVNGGYVLWNKTRVDSVCDPTALNRLAELKPEVQFVTTYGEPQKNVERLGKLPYTNMRAYIKNAGVYLATAQETLGIGTLEAMACGVPVLGWRFGGQTEIVEHGVTGYLADPNNYEDLLEGLEFCLAHRDDLGANARTVIEERWQWKHVIGGYYDAYKKAQKTYPVKTSVIITAYNLAEFLPDAIESVQNQTVDGWELIVVNDHSPDNCGEIAEGYAQQDSRIKVIHNSRNVYLAEARNVGIRASRGQYIIPLDADDMLEKDALRVLSNYLDKQPDLDIVTGSMEVIEPDGKRFVSGWPYAKSVGYEQQILKRNQIPYASMYRRGVWERTGGYRRRSRTAEDADFWTRAFSYGFVPKKVTEHPTLIYRNRPSSMSHTEAEPNWTSWFIWSKHAELRPWLVGGPVRAYDPVKVSVVVPVGPGHAVYLQDVLDSLVNQTFIDFEIIVVNDSGQDLNLSGFPFVHVVDNNGPKGTASARNRGFEEAKTPYVILLDADDYAQPIMVETLYKAIKTADGWVYSDWFADDGKQVYPQPAQSWDTEGMTRKALASVTGIYRKEDWAKVGGFNEHAPGWEDWDFHLKLLENCVCGTRVKYPLFVYRYRTGHNRDKDFNNTRNLVKYIQEAHPRIYKEGIDNMACSSCGKGRRADITVTKAVQDKKVDAMTTYTMRFIGTSIGVRRVSSSVPGLAPYRYSANEPVFKVHKDDLYKFINKKDQFRLVNDAPAQTESSEAVVINVTPDIVAERQPVTVDVPRPIPLEESPLDDHTRAILQKQGYDTVQQVMLAGDAELLTISGIGAKRLENIREDLKIYK